MKNMLKKMLPKGKEPKTDSPSVELLSEMYRNVTMGSENLATVVPMIRDKKLMTGVTEQLERYAEFTNKTVGLLGKRSVKPKDASIMKKMMSRGGIKMNTLIDSSDSHIAEMIEKGTKMGADSLSNRMNELKNGCERDALGLCGEILDFERRTSVKPSNPK